MYTVLLMLDNRLARSRVGRWGSTGREGCRANKRANTDEVSRWRKLRRNSNYSYARRRRDARLC